MIKRYLQTPGRKLAAAVLSVMLFGITTALCDPITDIYDSFTWAEIGDPGNAADVQTMNNPTETISVGSVDYTFQMSAYETTNAQYAYFLNTVDPTGANAKGLYSSSMASSAQGGIVYNSEAVDGAKYSVKSGYGLMPVVYVSWLDAARFVNWLNNGAGVSSSTESGVYDMSLPTQSIVRSEDATFWLPNEDEWHKAAYYDPTLNSGEGGYWLYPTQSNDIPNSRPGNDTDANSANFYRTGGSGGVNQGYAVTGSTSYNAATRYVTEVGAYGLSASAYGTFDQGGNVGEWTERITGSSRGLRGGSWGSREGDLRSSDRDNATPTFEISNVGFRIATVPEPSVCVFLVLSGVLFLAYKSKKITL